MVERVLITEAAAQAYRRHCGSSMATSCFTNPGGCCDGSAPMCYPARRVPGRRPGRTSRQHRRVPFLYWCRSIQYWRHTQLIIDVVPGRGSGFSLEAPLGVRFLTRSRVFTHEEADALERAGPPVRGV